VLKDLGGISFKLLDFYLFVRLLSVCEYKAIEDKVWSLKKSRFSCPYTFYCTCVCAHHMSRGPKPQKLEMEWNNFCLVTFQGGWIHMMMGRHILEGEIVLAPFPLSSNQEKTNKSESYWKCPLSFQGSVRESRNIGVSRYPETLQFVSNGRRL